MSPAQTRELEARVYEGLVYLRKDSVPHEFPIRLIVTPYEHMMPVPDPNGHFGDLGYAYSRDGTMRVHVVGSENNLAGPAGADGDDGWSPNLGVVLDGSRAVVKLVSWSNGTGTPPGYGTYMGPSGYVVDIADATDIRGPAGSGTGSNAFGVVVAGGTTLASDSAGDTLTVNAGTGISVSGNAGTDTITIGNTGVTSVNGSAGAVTTPYAYATMLVNGVTIPASTVSDTFTVNPGTGVTFTVNAMAKSVTIGNAGVTSVNGNTGAVTTPNTFQTVRASGVDLVADSISDVLTVAAGSGISLSANAGSDTLTITNSGVVTVNGASGAVTTPNAFPIVNVSGTLLVADQLTDTLNVVAGSGISAVGNAATDTMTLTNTGVLSLNNATGAIKIPEFINKVLDANESVSTTGWYEISSMLVSVDPGERLELTWQMIGQLSTNTSTVGVGFTFYSGGSATGATTCVGHVWTDSTAYADQSSAWHIGARVEGQSLGASVQTAGGNAYNVARLTDFSAKARIVLKNVHATKTLYVQPAVRLFTLPNTLTVYRGSGITGILIPNGY